MNGDYPPGATPLTAEEDEGLIPSHITTRDELNGLEQANILEAEIWLSNRRRRSPVCNTTFLKTLHKRMFGQVWQWAGSYRQGDRNIGVHWPQISYQTEALCRECDSRREHQSYPADEIAIRFHHELVSIHCFPNGNGRHSRLAADLLVSELGGMRFSWGSTRVELAGEVRGQYIEALKRADEREIAPLLAFART